MITTGVPPKLVDFVLPGVWVQCPVGDTAREEALLDLIRSSGSSGSDGELRAGRLRGQLDQLRAAGGTQIFFRQDRRPTLLTLAWPRSLPSPAIFAGHRAAIEALRGDAGGEATELKNAHGFWAVRAERSEDGSESSTYWIAHPVSARTLIIDVTIYSGDRSGLASYDSLVRTLSWKDSDLRPDHY